MPRVLSFLARTGERVPAVKLRGWPFLLGLAFVPGVGIALATVAGVHVAEVVIVEAWLCPIMLSAAIWRNAGAVASTAAAAVAVSPVVSHLIGAGMPSIGTGMWMAQSGLYLAFGLAVSALVGPAPLDTVSGAMRRSLGEYELDASDRVLSSLANTVEIRDHHTQGHCERVARNSVIMGQALSISQDESEVLYWAARLHDLGKIAVPEYILLKSGRLTEEEFQEIRRHPSYGADLLASVSRTYRPIADVVRAHHERWDGLGYPLGYKGDEIPRLARIIAIVDVFEALTSERPYRSPMPDRQALEYVKNGAGSQFDPELVTVFVALYERGEIECAGGARRRITAPSPSSDFAAYPNA